MNRLGLLNYDEMTTEQKQLYDDFTEYTGINYGTSPITKLPNGLFIGPFAIHLHHPAVGQAFLSLAKALRNVADLSPRLREIVILTVGGVKRAAYETYAHETLGARAGLSEREIEQIHEHKKPETLAENEKVAFEMASELCTKSGPLSDTKWDGAVKVLGLPTATSVVFYVGFYQYVSSILNGFDQRVPENDDA